MLRKDQGLFAAALLRGREFFDFAPLRKVERFVNKETGTGLAPLARCAPPRLAKRSEMCSTAFALLTPLNMTNWQAQEIDSFSE